ncbi:DNA-binding transcriptional LysR family regulator [Yoonia sediminilitoris]|uniref:DNA-binding transcriptional LysR family regulator n=1 Tax=Yoonia sediminilitoris TaxID=1286148 RepID=A0A2T6K4W0_9RHOB|nr:DNA-binding transcriptional LysR family regulator [Yoonia sediminilitoris]RCW89520.1 DNA-binding transcriptional LysR family regulator [Yoonia sediminilitoris]
MFIDPKNLEQLAAVVEHGTLQEAARQLRTSQPALSRMISNLENRLGVKLFERSSRPLIPTEIGLKLSQRGRAIKTIRERAYEDVQLGLKGLSGVLTIGAPPFLCERLVGDAISTFLRERPSILVKLRSDYFPQLERYVALNQVDALICPLRLLASPKKDLVVESLFEDEHVVVLRKDHALTKKSTIDANDLQSATWISHAEHSMLRSDMATALTSFGVENLHIAFQSESSGAIMEMLRSTDFLTVLPRYAILGDQAKDRLAELPVRFVTSAMTVGIVTPRNRLESPLLAAFTNHMRSYVQNDLHARYRLSHSEKHR